MRHGICILPEYRWTDAEPLWRRAEELGYDHAWTYDHLVWAGLPDAPWHSTVATLAAAATATSRIGLGTLVASPNYRHPVTFTRDVLTLDDVSRGRLLLGLGAGGDRDAQILGDHLTRGQRTRRFAEFVRLLDRTLTQDHVDHEGEFYVAVDARTRPGCVQQPRVPFVVAADGPRSMALAAQLGSGWLTTGPRAGVTADDEGTAGVERWWAGLGEVVERFEEVRREHGDRTLDRYLMLDSAGPPALSSVAFHDEQVARAADLGFTDVILHWPRPQAPYLADPAVLEAVAPAARA